MKTAECVGVREITRVNAECPYCGAVHEFDYPYFTLLYGDPFLEEHNGSQRKCTACKSTYKLGKFRLED